MSASAFENFRISTFGGNDRIDLNLTTLSDAATILGGTGNDSIAGGAQADARPGAPRR